MSKERKSLEELVQEALENVRDDRGKILEAYNKMKDSLDSEDQEKSMLLGNIAVKVLEQLTKSNEQIVRLAQIKEREETKKELKKDKVPIDIEALVKGYEENELDKNN